MTAELKELIVAGGRVLVAIEREIKKNGLDGPSRGVDFPTGVIRTANYFREQYPLSDRIAQTNVAYHLILMDLFRWILSRLRIVGTAREMLIKNGIVLVAAIAESILPDVLAERAGVPLGKAKGLSFEKLIDGVARAGIIDEELKKWLHWLRRRRNKIHLRATEFAERGRYDLKHYNAAITILWALRESLYGIQPSEVNKS